MDTTYLESESTETASLYAQLREAQAEVARLQTEWESSLAICEKLARDMVREIDAARADEREQCIKAICPFCRGDYSDYKPAEQTDYGAWLHPHIKGIDNDWVPCEAAAIRRIDDK